MFICFLSLFVSFQVSDAYLNVGYIIVFFSLNFSFFDMFSFLKNFCSIKYVLLAFFILSCKSIWLLLSPLSITHITLCQLLKPNATAKLLFTVSLVCRSFVIDADHM